MMPNNQSILSAIDFIQFQLYFFDYLLLMNKFSKLKLINISSDVVDAVRNNGINGTKSQETNSPHSLLTTPVDGHNSFTFQLLGLGNISHSICPFICLTLVTGIQRRLPPLSFRSGEGRVNLVQNMPVRSHYSYLFVILFWFLFCF